MNTEQIDEIALRVAKERYVAQHSGTGDGINFANYAEFTHALLAELAKVQEPVAMYCGYNPSMGHVFRADAVIEVGTYLYTQPPQQPDLVTEIEAAYDAGYADGYADGYRTCFEE